MKKSFKLLSAALIALASFVPAQAEELTVFGAGTATCEEVPIRGYWFDTEGYTVQTILPESEFVSMMDASVTSMKFYIADAGGNQMNGGKLAVSIGTTSQSSYYSYSPSFITTGLTQVAEITMTPGETEVVIDFDEPWEYNGGNILIQTYVVTAGNAPDVKFLGEPSSVSNAVYGRTSPTAKAFYPKTTFTYTGGVEDMAKVTPDALAFGTVYLDNTATLAITVKNLGKNAFTPVFSGLQAPFSIAAATEVASGETKTFDVTFTSANIGEYAQTLTVDCGAAGQFEIPVTGVAAEKPAEVVVAEGSVLSSVLPVEVGAYNYSGGNQAQMIYNGDLLTDLVGKKINGIKFHASAPLQSFDGGQIQLSLKVVEQSTFESATAITDLTAVATGAPAIGDSELVFVFDEPFTYEGGNLVVETLTTQGGSYSFKDKFLGVSTTDYVSFGYFNDLGWERHTYKYLPMATFSYVKEDTPEPELNDVYIIGDVNNIGWSATQGVQMTYDETNKVYTADITTQEQGSLGVAYFGFTKKLADPESETAWDDIAPYRFGPVSNGAFEMTEEMLGTDCTLATDGSYESIAMPAGTWTVTVDLENNTFKIVGEWPVDTVTPEPYTGDLYILGEANGNGWNPAVGVKMNYNAEEAVFTAQIDAMATNYDEALEANFSYFSFTKVLAETEGDWAAIAGQRIGAVSSGDFLVTEELLGQELSITNGENAFKVPSGYTYEVTVSVDNMKAIINRVAWQLGDVNHDKSVDVNDVTTIISYILGSNPQPFFLTEANVDGDAEAAIDVNDVTGLIYNILNAK